MNHARKVSSIALCIFALAVLASCGGSGDPGDPDLPLPGAPLSTPTWYVIADAGGANGGNDWLFTVDITLAAPLNGQTAVGTGTGTSNIEGAAFWPGTDTLYAFDSARLGTINLTTGVWSAIGPNVWDDGGAATISGLDANRNPEVINRTQLDDIDSVSFDPNTGIAYGVDREAGADILFQFDRVTGLMIRNAFNIGGTSYTFFRVPAVEPGNEDIDDIAISPYDSQLYGIANGGGLQDRLVRIEKYTGLSSDVGLLGVNDMEGFAFYNDGSMWGTTGGSSGAGNDNSVFSIDERIGTAYDKRPLLAGGSDFESIAFLTGDLNTFCGKVWCDITGNGIFDGPDFGVPNVTVVFWRDVTNNDVLDADSDVMLVTTTTDGSGDYCFRVASDGDYVITIVPGTLPADFVLTMPNVQEASVTGIGQSVLGLDFVKTGAVGTIGDTVWMDADQDGVHDAGEPGMRGVTVNLFTPGPDATCGTADDVFAATTTTDGGGYYQFPGNVDGAYCVDVDESTLPPGYLLTTANEPHAAAILAGSNDLTADFGYWFPCRVGDFVWLDADGDGVQDPGEPGLASIDVTLIAPGPDGYLGTADDVNAGSTTTAADGSYLFSGLNAGAYQVTVDVSDAPAGTSLTTTSPLNIWLTIGEFQSDVDFGFVGNGSIGDRVWNDTDGDANEDAGEPGIAGVTLNLTEAGPDLTPGTADDIGYPPQVTVADGSYSFPGLPPGTYLVDVDESTLPAMMRSLTTSNEPLVVPLGVGTNFTTADFGYMLDSGSIGDRVWDDYDGDGTQDAGEPGLVGVTVNLTGAGPDALLGTADDVAHPAQVTGVGGAYDFTGLTTGPFRVDVVEATLPAGAALTTGNEPLDVVLSAGQDYNAADFGYFTAALIGDRVWDDLDGDGTQDVGEPGIGGVTVNLTEAGPDATHGTADDVAVGSMVTAGDGSYGFPGLVPGNYRIDVVDASVPAGMVTTTSNDPLDETLTPGEQFTDGDFGYWRPASIGDRVWDDLDGDGTQDAGELGLGGISIDLTEAGPDATFGTADDVAHPAQVTAADGSYAFPNLPGGSYRVDVVDATVPVGFALSTGNDPFDQVLVPGQNVTNADFGYWRAASIGDRVWDDQDGDGLQDAGEPGLGGVTVSLVQAGPDALFGTGDDILYPNTVTAADGSYGFTGLPPGLTRVDVVDATVPAGMALTTGNDPFDLVLTPGDNVTTVDFGYRHTGRIGDRIWDDLDGDGIQDAGEPGLTGITVQLSPAGPDGMCGTADDGPQTARVTGAGGAYVFDGLAPGVYCVLVDGATVPPGYVPTTGIGILTVALLPGQDYTDADFGYRQIGAIGDRVWEDLDGDGLQDAGEPGIAGVSVDLVEAGPDATFGTADDVLFVAQVTAADGSYMFTPLGPGSYRVTVNAGTVPAGMALTTANLPLDVVLLPGQGYALADFGYRHTGSIGDRVWHDLDDDGVQDAGEPGLGSIGVDLVEAGPDATLGTADDVSFPAQATAADGSYVFANRAPGTYRVTVNLATVPAGMLLTTGNQPLDVALAASQVYTAGDFGYQFGASIGDRVWEDLDGDTNQDAGEPGIGGVTMNLVEAGPDATLGTADDVALPAQVTAADGSYLFPYLPPGDYRVTVNGASVPAGMALTTGNLPLDVAIVGATDVTTADFGYRHTASIGDFVWEDLDGDGNQDAGESGLAGIGVDLVEAGPDATLGTADDVTLPAQVTGAGGAYAFQNLPPGTYRVTVNGATVPAGMVLTTGNQPLDVALAAGQTYATADFGYQSDASIGDRIWEDLDGDGNQDAGEPGIGGVTLTLVEAGVDGILGTADDVALPSATTAADGSYGFPALPPGLYRVGVNAASVPLGMALTTGNEPLDVPLAASQVMTTADFGYRHTGSIGDRVWNDLDGDSNQDAGEPGLVGVRLLLDEAGPDGTFGTADDVAVGNQLTVAGGAYGFGNLPPGVYRVSVDGATLPPGAALTTGNEPYFVTLIGGQMDTLADFGYRDTGSIGDRVWEDRNGDGVQDPAEAGVPGVSVDLIEAGPDGLLGTADDVSVATVVTAADGSYGFGNLGAGLFRVTVQPGTVPAGMALTTGNQPLDVPLAGGQTVTTADFGYRHPASIGDRVWDDVDHDGLQDAGEPGIPSVNLVLVEAGVDGVLGTADDVSYGMTTTAADGSYVFPGLAAGTYRVDIDEVSLPAGYSLTGGTEPLDVPLGAGVTYTTADFGYAPPLYTVGDVIWIDSDRDGIYEPIVGERALVGVPVTLFDMMGNVIATDTTNAAGEYRFTVPGGMYRVEVDPSNFLPGGLLEGLTSTGAGTDVIALIASDNFDLDFGFVGIAPGAIRFCSWWLTSPATWPLQTMTLGGRTYSQSQAMALLSSGNDLAASMRGRSAARVAATADMSVLVAWALIGAKLNVGAGNNSAGVEATIRAADAWLASVGVGTGIVNGRSQFRTGQTYYLSLNLFNGGGI